MVSFDTSSFNWIAIVLAGLSAWIIGGIWFSPPVFGRRWMAALGMKPEDAGNPAPGFAAALVISIIGAIFLRWVIGVAGATSIVEGIEVALIIWFAVILLPPDRWHMDGVGNRRDVTADYKLKKLPDGRTRLHLQWRRRPNVPAAKELTKAQREADALRAWKRFAVAMERDYRRSQGRRMK